MASFSDRQGIVVPDAPITIRNEAPQNLREAVIAFARKAGLSASTLRSMLCNLLGMFPDGNNWSEPNVMGEVEDLIHTAPWNNVYDFSELVHAHFYRAARPDLAEQYATDLNNFFRRHGIGWSMLGGQIQFRGTAELESTLEHAITSAQTHGLTTIPEALREARRALSTRPKPNTRDAINNAIGALEAAARHVSGNANPTLGEIVKANPALFPGALKKMADGVWGYASEEARHFREGSEPPLKEAELVVGIAATVASYLLAN